MQIKGLYHKTASGGLSVQCVTPINWEFEKTFKHVFDTFSDEEKESLKTQQNPLEIDTLLMWIKERIADGNGAPMNYLEVGSYAGESLFFISQVLPPQSHVVLVDYTDHPIARKVLMEVIDWVRKLGILVDLLTKDSTDVQTPNLVKILFKQQPIDLCFIDANHTFNFAYMDLQNYGPLAGFTVLHDVSKAKKDSSSRYGYVDQAMVSHIWQVIKLVLPQSQTQGAGSETETTLVLWDEIIDKYSGLKPRGFGILNSGVIFSND